LYTRESFRIDVTKLCLNARNPTFATLPFLSQCELILFFYNICLLPSDTTTLIKYPGYRMSLYYICFRLHASAVKRPSSGLYCIELVM